MIRKILEFFDEMSESPNTTENQADEQEEYDYEDEIEDRHYFY